jgi:hypothetical protein
MVGGDKTYTHCQVKDVGTQKDRLPFRTQLQEMEKRMALYQILNAKE